MGDLVGVGLALDHGAGAGRDVPAEDLAVEAAGGDGLAVAAGLDAQRGDALIVSLDDAHGFVAALVEIIEVTAQAQADDEPVGPAVRPDHADLLVAHVDAPLLADAPRAHALARLCIPHAHRLVGARGGEALRVLGPAHGKDAARVHALADVLGRLAGLAVVQLDAPVGANGNQQTPVRAEGGAHDEALVQAGGLACELEGGAVKEAHGAVIGHSGGAQGALLADGNGVDDLAVTADLADAVAAVGGEAVAEALAAVANGDDALAVAVPGEVGNAARDDGVVSLGVDGLDGVPHAHLARDVGRGDPEARRRELGDGGGGRVARVLLREVGIIDAAEEDGLAGLWKERLEC